MLYIMAIRIFSCIYDEAFRTRLLKAWPAVAYGAEPHHRAHPIDSSDS